MKPVAAPQWWTAGKICTLSALCSKADAAPDCPRKATCETALLHDPKLVSRAIPGGQADPPNDIVRPGAIANARPATMHGAIDVKAMLGRITAAKQPARTSATIDVSAMLNRIGKANTPTQKRRPQGVIRVSPAALNEWRRRSGADRPFVPDEWEY